jgi:hypothetical protein
VVILNRWSHAPCCMSFIGSEGHMLRTVLVVIACLSVGCNDPLTSPSPTPRASESSEPSPVGAVVHGPRKCEPGRWCAY